MSTATSRVSVGPTGEDISSLQPIVRVGGYVCVFFCVALATAAGKIIAPFFDATIITLLYLLPVLFAAVWWGRGPSLFASLLGVLVFDFFFVHPVSTSTAADFRDVATLAIFLLAGVITGSMATRLRNEVEKTRQREKETLALYAISKKIASQTDLNEIASSLAQTALETTGGPVSILVPDRSGLTLDELASRPPHEVRLDEKEQAVVRWVLEHSQPAGRGTETLSNACALVFPAKADDKTVAALVIDLPGGKEKPLPPDAVQLIEAMANLVAVAIVRTKLAREAEQVQRLAESEKLHRALLNSMSHDLRTPLASIMGAVTGLLEEGNSYDEETTRSFLEIIEEGAVRLNRFVANLLDTARFESDTLRLKKEWCDIQDVVGVALKDAENLLRGRAVCVDIPSDLPMIRADFALLEHVLINLLENGAKYSSLGSEIGISARSAGTALLVSITDQGPPIPVHEREHVFEKFYRLQYARSMDGSGLGLAICRGIIEAHGGLIWVDPSTDAGNRFTFSLPATAQPTTQDSDEKGEDHDR